MEQACITADQSERWGKNRLSTHWVVIGVLVAASLALTARLLYLAGRFPSWRHIGLGQRTNSSSREMVGLPVRLIESPSLCDWVELNFHPAVRVGAMPCFATEYSWQPSSLTLTLRPHGSLRIFMFRVASGCVCNLLPPHRGQARVNSGHLNITFNAVLMNKNYL